MSFRRLGGLKVVVYGRERTRDNLGPDGIAGGYSVYEGHVTFYFAVPDVEAALQKAESLGGERVMGPERIMDMVTLGQFKDPEGHVIGVVEPQPEHQS
jgi:predicted enzyme related to lactoylglutathione lyase